MGHLAPGMPRALDSVMCRQSTRAACISIAANAAACPPAHSPPARRCANQLPRHARALRQAQVTDEEPPDALLAICGIVLQSKGVAQRQAATCLHLHRAYGDLNRRTGASARSFSGRAAEPMAHKQLHPPWQLTSSRLSGLRSRLRAVEKNRGVSCQRRTQSSRAGQQWQPSNHPLLHPWPCRLVAQPVWRRRGATQHSLHQLQALLHRGHQVHSLAAQVHQGSLVKLVGAIRLDGPAREGRGGEGEAGVALRRQMMTGCHRQPAQRVGTTGRGSALELCKLAGMCGCAGPRKQCPPNPSLPTPSKQPQRTRPCGAGPPCSSDP